MTRHEFDPSALLDALRSSPDIDLVRQLVTFMYQGLIDVEAADVIGAEPYEHSLTRTTRRNGSRPRTLSTKAGDIDLRIPKLREGSFFPSVLERRRRIDRALYAVVMEAYVHGVSTRKVDALVQALGADTGISKSEVSRICADMDGELEAFRSRDLGHVGFPYVFCDATYVKARVNGRVVSRAVVVATGITTNGEREILGINVGDSEDRAFWTEFLSGLRQRGLSGVELVVSDAHVGLKTAIAQVFIGAAWQRCRVHFMRNVLARVPKIQSQMVSALIRTVFAQPDQPSVRQQLIDVSATLAPKFPDVAELLDDAADDVCAFASFPRQHWTKLWSTNSIERLNAEIKRRTRVVGIFPNDASALRLITAVCVEQHDEWLVAEKRYMSEASMALLRASKQDGSLEVALANT
ncbi:MAG TPA: IS256 family transposase [Acidimicrobiales bacterium]|jgi:transposase-like protein